MLTIRHAIRIYATLAACFVLAGSLRAGDSFSPTSVTVGTQVLITGSGFNGGKTPKVTGTLEGSKKRVRFRVDSFDENSIVATAKKTTITRLALTGACCEEDRS
jgi:hypothetical protein